jgi:hypothetical protein
MIRSSITTCIATCIALAATSAGAHHSLAMFDRNKQITLTGTVEKFLFTNPHMWIIMKVPDGKGDAQTWEVEGTSPSVLHRFGWTRNSIQAGETITLVISPLRDGRMGGSLEKVTKSNGQELHYQRGLRG